MKFTRIEPFMSCLRPELQQSYFATVHQSKAFFCFVFLLLLFFLVLLLITHLRLQTELSILWPSETQIHNPFKSLFL